jgi:hypothetical protein
MKTTASNDNKKGAYCCLVDLMFQNVSKYLRHHDVAVDYRERVERLALFGLAQWDG